MVAFLGTRSNPNVLQYVSGLNSGAENACAYCLINVVFVPYFLY